MTGILSTTNIKFSEVLKNDVCVLVVRVDVECCGFYRTPFIRTSFIRNVRKPIGAIHKQKENKLNHVQKLTSIHITSN